MPENRLISQLKFIHEIDKLKYVYRQSCLFESDRRENSAEHSWHLALMISVLKEYAVGPIDELKVIKMLLIHDLVEIYAGDTFLFDDSRDDPAVAEVEAEAACKLFSLLPRDQLEEYLSLWQEFEEGLTENARFAKAIDRLQPVLQNLSNNGGTWRKHQIELNEILDKISSIGNASDNLWNEIQTRVESMVDW
jgi:putative hydrolase of HD superfamily